MRNKNLISEKQSALRAGCGRRNSAGWMRDSLIRAPLLALFPLVIAAMAPLCLRSQTLSFAAAQTTVAASGLRFLQGVAVDAAGDVFIADSSNNPVVEVSPRDVQVTVSSGLNFPEGVAVDAAGDVFIADTSNNRVAEVQRSQAPTLNLASTNRQQQ